MPAPATVIAMLVLDWRLGALVLLVVPLALFQRSQVKRESEPPT